ncbi:MAG: hypothetical protein QXI54_05460 [Archaeoglobaceae archaeon]
MELKRENTILTRVDDYIIERINAIVEQSKDLNLTKSEVVYVILKAFFAINPKDDIKKVRELIIKNRQGVIKYKS